MANLIMVFSLFLVTTFICVQSIELGVSFFGVDGLKSKLSSESLEKIDQSSEFSDFHCQETGRFANPNSCESYIECSEDYDEVVGSVVQCPYGQHFNLETKNCDDKCTAECDQDSDCTCRWPHCLITCEKPNGLFPVPTNCRLYVECKDSLPRIHRCPEGRAFDTESKDCIPIEETNCQPAKASNDILNIMRN